MGIHVAFLYIAAPLEGCSECTAALPPLPGEGRPGPDGRPPYMNYYYYYYYYCYYHYYYCYYYYYHYYYVLL